VGEQLGAVAVLARVFALRIEDGEEGLHARELVAADAPNAHLLGARLRVEVPARGVLHQRDRQRPALLAHRDLRVRVVHALDLVRLGPGLEEPPAVFGAHRRHSSPEVTASKPLRTASWLSTTPTPK